MYKIQLEVEENTRWLTKIDYDYFCPVNVSIDYYKNFLRKNFPFDLEDTKNLAPYHSRSLPTVKQTRKDKELQREAYERATESNHTFSPYWVVKKTRHHLLKTFTTTN